VAGNRAQQHGAGVIVMDESGLISAVNPSPRRSPAGRGREALKRPWQEVLTLVHEPGADSAEPSPSERILRAENHAPLSMHASLRAPHRRRDTH